MKPPSLPLGSNVSSSNTLSSLSSNVDNHDHHNQHRHPRGTISAGGTHSHNNDSTHRLVDYFVIYTSKPPQRTTTKKQKQSNGGTNSMDKSDYNDGEEKEEGRAFCCKKKQVKRQSHKQHDHQDISSTNKSETGTDAGGTVTCIDINNSLSISTSIDSETPSPFSQRAKEGGNPNNSNDEVKKKRSSARAVHLSDQQDEIILDNINIDSGEEEGDKTPIRRHRKSVSTSPTTSHGKKKKGLFGRKEQEKHLFKLPTSFRVPATKGNLASSPSDFESDTDDVDSNHDKNDNCAEFGSNDGVITPSKLRAIQGLKFESNDSGDYHDINDSHEETHTNQNHVDSPEIRSHDNNYIYHNQARGPSENIHLPSQVPTYTHDNNNNPSSNSHKNIYLTPVETARYPQRDHQDAPFNSMITHFCFPDGQNVPLTTEYIMPKIHYFVLTNERNKKMYGTCLTIYEEFHLKDSDNIDIQDLRHFCRNDDVSFVESTADEESSIEVSLDYADKLPPLYHPKVICLLSSWPYLHAFRVYLSQLYRLATMTNLMTCPIERYVLNICDEVPAPPPGMFEIRLKILDSNIRFWAPPAKQPIPYVSIPFHVLFECLDLNNVLFVWYALTLEHKVLLVSSQNTLLTLCAEILCALLFPMERPNVYVPNLPLFLSPMLDAPFPYLCGITRENFKLAIENVNEETIVVDLDQNLITKGERTPEFPPMPLKRRAKLEACLQNNVGDVFWLARGVTKSDVEQFQENAASSSSIRHINDINKTARIWKQRLNSFDDAFNLALTPDSEALLDRENRTLEDGLGQSKWDCIQEGFLTFFVAMLRDYKRFISKTDNQRVFKSNEFLNTQRSDFKPFLTAFVETQHFDMFITKAILTPNEPDVIFFDQSITAKKNRSKMTLKKKRTPFLHSAKAQKQLRIIEAAKPCVESNFNLLDVFYSSTFDAKKFSYSKFPETFDPNLMKNPRKIPDVIAAEFDRRADCKNQDNEIVDWDDFHVTAVSTSIEVTVFTIFFILCSELAGLELQMIQNQYLSQGETILNETSVENRAGGYKDCTNICAFGSTAKTATVTDEYKASLDQLAGFGVGKNDSKLETARLVAFAELDLAFSALDMLFMRKLKPSVDALKALMSACGRCDSSDRATKLINTIHEKRVHIDSETYYFFYRTAQFDDKGLRKDWMFMKSTTLNRKKRGKKNRADDYLEGSENSSYSGTGSSMQDSMSETLSSNVGRSNLPPRHSKFTRRKKQLTSRKDLFTTDHIETHIKIGDSLLTYLYKDLYIDVNNATCQSCGTILEEDQVRLGWNSCSYTDNTTECPQCKSNFVPSFVVKSSDPNFIGSQGPGTPLHCDFLSPWVLHKEIHMSTRDSNLKDILDPQWRNSCDKNTTIWWNLIVSLKRHKLPITFLLQGSFRERLIMPMPD